MALTGVLVANRGEIAIRVLRAASELGLRTATIHSADDARSLHVRHADTSIALEATGAAAYMDAERIVAAARDAGCDAVHPGYGFLAENEWFARTCAGSGLTFVGPSPQVLALFGSKVRARRLAASCGVPVLHGTDGPASLPEAAAMLEAYGSVMLKAVAGGGGRGMRAVTAPEDLEEAYRRCRSEAEQSFGSAEIYAERLVERARHIEVQVVGDGSGAVRHLWERDCSLQRRYQKLVEVAPAPGLPAAMRTKLLDAAVAMATSASFGGVGTFEFLVWEDTFAFIECNPRLQVEHTVTEEVTGVDLVRAQLLLAGGANLGDLDLPSLAPDRTALQVRVNTETIGPDGSPRPSHGRIAVFEPPSGPGVRVDTCGFGGFETNPRYDSLLAKVVVRADDVASAAARAYRALSEFRIEGAQTNVGFLQSLLLHADVTAGRWHTRFVEEHAAELGGGDHPKLYAEDGPRLAGVKVDPDDPLAVLAYGKTGAGFTERPAGVPIEGLVTAPLQGTVVSVAVREGDRVRAGGQLLVMEAMKMEHVVAASSGGVVLRVTVAEGDTVHEGHPLVQIYATDVDAMDVDVTAAAGPDGIRPDLAEVHAMHARTADAARPDAVARRRATSQRTARENIDDLCDPGSFVEYGSLVISSAAGGRQPLGDLIERSATDGLVTGIGRVNGHLFDESRSRAMVLAYDYTVLAGTQGGMNHRKKDRMFEIAEKMRIPVVFFTEGGGGRAGGGGGRSSGATARAASETAAPRAPDGPAFAGGTSVLDPMAFHLFGRLSGLVPLVGVTSGRCFAGNAALLGCCDVVIATADSSIGMGGPAMIEGGGLGVFRPEEVGPIDVQAPNGVVDVAVGDETEAVHVAKRYLSYFQGSVAEWTCDDQRSLRAVVPENRLRVYDVRTVIDTMSDEGSVLELRRHFGPGMVTAFARMEGRPVGVVANNPAHMAGAIESTGADKAARFMQLCDAFDIPVVFLCDTPGIMVGPEAEKTALVRHAARMFVTGANLTVPFVTVVLRKAYGLGAMAMAGGSFKVPLFAIAWPTGEFGGMGLEGQVKLGSRDLLASIEDPQQRRAVFEQMVARLYEYGRALNTATAFGIDDVIDPADTRLWIAAALSSQAPPPPRAGKKRPNVDTW